MSKVVFVNGHFSDSLSDIQSLSGVVISHADGLSLRVLDNQTVKTPIHVLFMTDGQQSIQTQFKHHLELGKNSKLILVEEYKGLSEAAYTINALSTLRIAEGAKLEQLKIQNENKLATHLATTHVYQDKDSQVDLVYYSTGAHLAKDEISITLAATGAECKTSGFYHTSVDNQSIDFHINAHHAASSTHSEMLFKGIVDKKSRAIFNGRLHVNKEAQKITASQANHNILLSPQAQVCSQPELEIYADDVKCKHGATVGQLDQDALFYLRARGIEEKDAKEMLLAGFAEEVVGKISALWPIGVMSGMAAVIVPAPIIGIASVSAIGTATVMPAQAGIQGVGEELIHGD